MSKRLDDGLDSAAAQARRIIHENDVERLKELLAEYPALLSWQGGDNDAGLLGFATSAYGDAGSPEREQWFTRPACADLLIDAGAIVSPSVCRDLLRSRAAGLLKLFQSKGLLPRTLEFLAALGDADAVRAALHDDACDLKAVNDAFLRACHFEHETVASLLLERSMALDPTLRSQVAGADGPAVFIRSLMANRSQYFAPDEPWHLFVKQQVMRLVDGDPAMFVSSLEREPWLLGAPCVRFQVELVERATLHDRGSIIAALLALDPALLRRQPPPSKAIEFALTYARSHLIPLLTRIWPMPDDLPHAAGMGDLSRVKRWFDQSGRPVLGDLNSHYPHTDHRARVDLHWDPPTSQHVLDTALAFAVINRHFEVADFLLAHGADINTRWGSHEPASILHELVGQVATGENPEANDDAMRFLIDRGIDLTIKDYRWNSTAKGWARHAANDEKLAQWLEDAERRRGLV